MVALKEFVVQELNNLNEEQIKQVVDFIAFLKFRSRRPSLQFDPTQIALLYGEFAQEDSQLAEEGFAEYAEILKQEDLK
jgi:succinate dehydrogenase flavin-adding protein (antitoxin of CptAB toxin-antitoxin module)